MNSVIFDAVFPNAGSFTAQDNLSVREVNPQKYITQNIGHFGNKYLLANGCIGYRGTMEEYGAAELAALNIAGLYDDSGNGWRENVNAPNPLFARLILNSKKIGLQESKILRHKISLNIFDGVLTRETLLESDGIEISIESERFVSYVDKNLIVSRYSFSFNKDALIVLQSGIDGDVWDINGKHTDYDAFSFKPLLQLSGKTRETKTEISVAVAEQTDFINFGTIQNNNGSQILINYKIDCKAGKKYTVTKYCAVVHGENAAKDAAAAAAEYKSIGFSALKQAHTAAFNKAWEFSDVVLEGDEEAQLALRYSIYHLLILAPGGNASIAARGLSGQTYKGAVFWDTEIFMLPFFLSWDYGYAKKLIQYRIDGLTGARTKAASYGYKGAFYAWESQDNGFDACSDFNVVDVFTSRKVRTHFKDKQIHISADVIYAMAKYIGRTGDTALLESGGLETALACAEFYYNYSYYNHIKKRFELLDVTGPDEYHERVNNNAFTNYMAHFCVRKALEFFDSVKKRNGAAAEEILKRFDPELIKNLKHFAGNLYLPAPGKEGIIEQFDGYFGLEDVSVAEVRSRLVHPNEYWGGSGGVATATKVIKQADVIALLFLLPEYFSPEIIKPNWNYYIKHTEHGSSLSACMYSVTACGFGMTEESWKWFLKTATIDLSGDSKQYAGKIYIGGTHPAANGGAWITAVNGFCGYKDGSVKQCFPSKISKISFTALEGGKRIKYTLTKDSTAKEVLDD